MLTHEEISRAVVRVASVFPVKRAAYFGSYAEGRQSETSDLDILLEFHHSKVSLITLSAIKNDLEDQLNIPVDVIHAPIPNDSLIKIGKVVQVYG